MDESSLSFLVKDRYLDDNKRQWVKANVPRRECVQFVSMEEAKSALGYPSSARHTSRQSSAASGAAMSPEEEDAMMSEVCRCGRQYSDHVHQQDGSSTRDYRLFSDNFSTDVVLEIVQPELSKRMPVSYSPKQVIRLAADTNGDTLHHLITTIWHVPKASFLVSVYGSCDGQQNGKDLADNLSHLLRNLSNPGNALLTVSLTDQELYQQALKACDVACSLLPFTEIVPVVFLPWTCLTSDQKSLLRDVTRSGQSIEHKTLREDISVLDVRKKAYFLFADYGVDLDLGADHHDHGQGPQSTQPGSDDNDDDDDVYHTLPPSSDEEGEKEEVVQADKECTDHSSRPSDLEKGERTEDEGDTRQEKGEATVSQQNRAEAHPSSSSDPGVKEDEQAAANLARDEAGSESEEGAGRGGSGHRFPDERSPLLESSDVTDDQLSMKSRDQTSLVPDRRKIPDAVESTGQQSPSVEGGEITDDQPSGKPLNKQSPSLESGQRTDDQQTVPSEAKESTSAQPTASDDRTETSNEEEKGKKFKLFSYSFPHPLRTRVEALLEGHTHDFEGQGTLMILHGCTSFVDLAAAHGAIRSGVPVIVDQHGTGATALLLAIMKTMDKGDDNGTADLMAKKRHFVVKREELLEAIQLHSSKETDLTRDRSNVFWVLDGLLTYQHLLTLYDIQSDSSFLDAAVEAFIKAGTEEEAVLFIKKNTLRLAAEDDDHPRKRAQIEFQTATMKVAMKLNRPEIMDVVFDHGFVSAFDVFGNCDRIGLTSQERQQILDGDDIPYSQIRDLPCFQARQCFVQHVCKFPEVSANDHGYPTSVVQHLFLYSVLNVRTSLAKCFWKQAVFQDHVAHALVASHVSTYLADKVPGDEQAQAFRLQAQEFESLAKGTLDDCYEQDPKKASAIMTHTADTLGVSPIEAAISLGMRSFVGHPASSDYLDSVWKGQFMPSSSRAATKQTCCREKCSPLVKFFTTPRTVCFTTTILYLLFLTLYGHSIIFQSGKGRLSPLDIVLIVWTMSFLVEEVLQFLNPNLFLVVQVQKKSRMNLKAKLCLYFSDHWNIMDFLDIFFFILGYVLRLALPRSEAGHVILSLVYILFFFRLLHVMTVSRTIGPMLPMIWKMLGDLVPFLIILFIFVLAYGLASEALLHAGTSWHALYLLYLPRVAFWPIFGEYGLETIEGVDCENNTLWYTEGGASVLCPSTVGRHVVPVLMGLYILLTNVLMLNLLIAYFNHSFEKVHNESTIWWAWLRYGLIEEYYARPALPPPFILLYRVVQGVCLALYKPYRAGRWLLQKLCRCLCRCCREETERSGCKAAGASDWTEMDDLLVGESAKTIDMLAKVFAEEADILNDLDFQREIHLDMRRLYQRSFAIPCPDAIPRPDDTAVVLMLELKKWEGVRASNYLERQQRSKSSSKKETTHEDLQNMLLRLEKKIEDELKTLNRKLDVVTSITSLKEGEEEGPASPP